MGMTHGDFVFDSMSQMADVTVTALRRRRIDRIVVVPRHVLFHVLVLVFRQRETGVFLQRSSVFRKTLIRLEISVVKLQYLDVTVS